MINTELISFDAFDTDLPSLKSNVEKDHQDDFIRNQGDRYGFQLGVSGVKVVQNLQQKYQ